MLDGLTQRVDQTMDRVDDIQRSKAPIAVANAVLKKYGDDRGSQLAMLLAYNGFFSMFPLMLASISVLGIVLKGNPELRRNLIDSALSSIPVLGSDLDQTKLSGGSLVLVVSVFLAFWAGLGLLDMLQEALNTVWNVPRFERPGWVPRRARAMAGAIVILVCAGISGFGNFVLNTDFPDPFRPIAGAIFPVIAGGLAFISLHKILCARKLTLKELLPGAIAAALGWWGLFSLGNLYFNRVVKNASDTYGAFAVVLGLLSWSYLLGMMFIYSTEIASVLADRLWPRSLTGRRLSDADEEAIEVTAQREVKVKEAAITVELQPDSANDDPGGDDSEHGAPGSDDPEHDAAVSADSEHDAPGSDDPRRGEVASRR